MIELHGHTYEIGSSGKTVELNDVADTRTVSVTVRETMKRVIEVEIPDDASDEFATDVVAELYDKGDFYLDGDDTVDNVEFELT